MLDRRVSSRAARLSILSHRRCLLAPSIPSCTDLLLIHFFCPAAHTPDTNLGLDVVNGVRGFDLEGDGLTREAKGSEESSAPPFPADQRNTHVLTKICILTNEAENTNEKRKDRLSAPPVPFARPLSYLQQDANLWRLEVLDDGWPTKRVSGRWAKALKTMIRRWATVTTRRCQRQPLGGEEDLPLAGRSAGSGGRSGRRESLQGTTSGQRVMPKSDMEIEAHALNFRKRARVRVEAHTFDTFSLATEVLETRAQSIVSMRILVSTAHGSIYETCQTLGRILAARYLTCCI